MKLSRYFCFCFSTFKFSVPDFNNMLSNIPSIIWITMESRTKCRMRMLVIVGKLQLPYLNVGYSRCRLSTALPLQRFVILILVYIQFREAVMSTQYWIISFLRSSKMLKQRLLVRVKMPRRLDLISNHSKSRITCGSLWMHWLKTPRSTLRRKKRWRYRQRALDQNVNRRRNFLHPFWRLESQMRLLAGLSSKNWKRLTRNAALKRMPKLKYISDFCYKWTWIFRVFQS